MSLILYCTFTASTEVIAIITVSVVIVAGILITVIIVVILIIVVTAFSQKSKLKSPALVTTATNDNHDGHEIAFVQTDTEKSDTM